jgi:hypothetical protein
MASDIKEILARRTDLSTFLVHLTRDTDHANQAKQNLQAILKSRKLEGRNPFGSAFKNLRAKQRSTDSQKCVCFTETPIEQVSLLLGEIEGRHYDFKPYGVAITKTQGRRLGVNPVWYLDISPGHNWLTKHVDALIAEAIDSDNFDEKPISKLSPFIEQMGTGINTSTGDTYRKEFWWEREWRHLGDFNLPERLIVLCPEHEIDGFRRCGDVTDSECRNIEPTFIDPHWSLEQIIGHLAGFSSQDLTPF